MPQSDADVSLPHGPTSSRRHFLAPSASEEFEMGVSFLCTERFPFRRFIRHRSPYELFRQLLPGIVLALAPAAGLASPAGAQQPTSVVVGVVVDTEGRPLANAQVVVGSGLQATTQSSGHFRLDGVPAGIQLLEVHFVGYHAFQVVLEVQPEELIRVELTLTVDPVALEEVRASATGGLSPELQGFHQRRSRGNGHFFTREQITRMQPRSFTDVLRRVPGLQIHNASGPFGNSQVVQMGRATGIAGQRQCPVLFYMNGAPFPVSTDVGINTFIRPEDIAAIEVYSGASSVPAQFHSANHNSRCGVIVIWTYGGERRQQQHGRR